MAEGRRVGNRIAPPRFIAFAVALIIAVPAASHLLDDYELGLMAGFDVAALLFLALLAPLLAIRDGSIIRQHARENDANRLTLLAITVVMMAVLLVAIAAEAVDTTPQPFTRILVILTLVLTWLFGNSVYALHYAHLAYGDGDVKCSGIKFPATDQPDYWDFVYFAFTLGMTFQTSDVTISDAGLRRVVTLHSLAAFAFNIGVLAFTINVLGSA